MRSILARRQVVSLSSGLLAAAVLSFFPRFGPPNFRYTDSDPSHHVWNLGFPLATCIDDPVTEPHLFVGPIGSVVFMAAAVSAGVPILLLFAWNNKTSKPTLVNHRT